MFVRAKDFACAKGFDERWVIMEDADLAIRLHRAGTYLRPGKVCWFRSICHQVRRAPHTITSRTVLKQLMLQPFWGHFEAWASLTNLRVCLQRAAIHQVLYRRGTTCGRRFVVWGSWRSTYIHFKLSLQWYFGCSPEALKAEYDKIYRDDIR